MGSRLAVGTRRVLAWTCLGCHQLQDGEPERRPRKGSRVAYIDRRCKKCRWAHAEGLPGRNN